MPTHPRSQPTQRRLSGRLTQLLQQHLRDERALLERMQAAATNATADGLSSSGEAHRAGLSDLAAEVSRMQSRRASLRQELASSLQTPVERIRLSELDLSTPHETAEFRSECRRLRAATAGTFAKIALTCRSLNSWQRMLLTLLTEATGGHVAAERYSSTGQLVPATSTVLLEMRS